MCQTPAINADVVYKETEYKWYCSLYKGGSTKGSDVEVTCTVSGSEYVWLPLPLAAIRGARR